MDDALAQPPAGSGPGRSRVSAQIATLTGEAWYHSPAVPTIRGAKHLRVVMATPLPPRSMDGEGASTAGAPAVWVVLDHPPAQILAFARTATIAEPFGPLADGQRIPELVSSTTIPTAIKLLRQQLNGVASAFFEGEPADSDAMATADALIAMIPQDHRPWIGRVCADFWRWALPIR